MTAPSSSVDHTFKVSSNIGFWCEGKWIQLYDGLFIVINEIGVVLCWKLCWRTAFHKVEHQFITAICQQITTCPTAKVSVRNTADGWSRRTALCDEDGQRRRTRSSQDDSRRRHKITEILDDNVTIGVSSSSLVDSMGVFRTLQEFLILAVSNEPVSPLANAEVQKALKVVADKIHRKGHAGDALHYLLVGHSAFQTCAPDREEQVATGSNDPDDNESSIFQLGKKVTIVSKLRLALQHKYQLTIQQTAEVGELLCVTMKMGREEGQDNSQNDLRRRPQITEILDDKVKIGVSSSSLVDSICVNDSDGIILGVDPDRGSPLQDLFVLKGTALFVYQLTKDRKREPKDFYGRPLKEYWFKFTASPTDQELRILDEVMRMSSNLDPKEKQVLMSAFNPKLASEATPFYLNLNALLVISGNCHVFTKY
ncbi:hypothetical protein ACROYT_G014600 [Oculina patagonica]